MNGEMREQPSDLAARFEAVYEKNRDPWGLETRFYERRKRALSIASLPRERYGRAFEIGCSIGVMTEEIAQRVDDLLAVDVSPRAVAEARGRLVSLAHVRAECQEVPHDWPSGLFELITVSEVGFFMGADGLKQAVGLTAASLAQDGHVLLCHWRHPMSGWELNGDDVHRIFIEHSGLEVICEHLERDFRIDVLARETLPR